MKIYYFWVNKNEWILRQVYKNVQYQTWHKIYSISLQIKFYCKVWFFIWCKIQVFLFRVFFIFRSIFNLRGIFIFRGNSIFRDIFIFIEIFIFIYLELFLYSEIFSYSETFLYLERI